MHKQAVMQEEHGLHVMLINFGLHSRMNHTDMMMCKQDHEG